MTTTVTSAFQKMKENLEITGLQKSRVSARQQNVRKAVENEMKVLDSFLTGSYSRHTMIAPLEKADVDIFTVLNPSYFQTGGQASLLDKVRRVLLKTFPKTPKISRNGQAVTITFSDFIVDVVPAFCREGGGYLIPNSIKNEWISTNPKRHVELMSAENSKHDGNLVPSVKMIKCWNRGIDYAFESFYLELLAIETFKSVIISKFPSGMRYFFDKGREAIKYRVKDPVKYGGYINGLRNARTVEQGIRRFEVAYVRARSAEKCERQGYTAYAIDMWRRIFGAYFPSYG